MPRFPKASAEEVAEVLNAMAEGLSVTEILRKTGTSTGVLYKVLKDYPLWGSFMKRRD